MPNETRVNLLHLLQDIRDSYSLPVEEVIITELIANSLDSGASRIDFIISVVDGTICCLDNGQGMRRKELKDYHNIAATTKERGRGIGFAGIGAKLSLLIASRVITETHGPYNSRAATVWHLASPIRAPWKFVPSPGHVSSDRGTAVTIALSNQNSGLLNPEFVRKTIENNFRPLLDSDLTENFLRLVYPGGVEFFLNQEKITYQPPPNQQRQLFKVFLGSRSRRPVGVGYLTKQEPGASISIGTGGLVVSTYGKVIKKGWEWLGIIPKSFDKIFGIVEIPALAELLTTNKSDFLNDATSLKKYYRYRKAVQEAVLGVLQSLGEERFSNSKSSQQIKGLSKKIEETMGNLVGDFPELSTLMGVKEKTAVVNAAADFEYVNDSRANQNIHGEPLVTPGTEQAVSMAGINQKEKETRPEDGRNEGIKLIPSAEGFTSKKITKKSPGLKIGFEEFVEESKTAALARMVEDTVWINTAHPAWQKAKKDDLEEYHILISVAWVLSQFLEQCRSPHDFVSRFLSTWALANIEGGQAELI